LQVPCRVASSDGRFAYDLTALSRADRNWRASDIREGGKYAYELNVCRSLVARPGLQCNPFSGVCQLVNSSSSDFNLGFIGQPTVETTANGQPLLVLNYTGGDACHGGKFNRSARIEFTCPLDTTGAVMPGVLGEPEFLYESASCVYVFSWRTSVACPLGSFPPVVGSACQVSGPQLDRSFSLLPLAGQTYNLTVGDYSYLLSVCGGLSGTAVPSACDGAGGCQLKAGQAPVVTGHASSAVSLVNGAVVLNMTGGKPCHSGASIRSTLITFLCGTEPVGKPQFVTETLTCEYIFVWYTAAACGTPKQTECVAVDLETGFTYDLSPLARTTTNWLVL
jgi:insulin-like growth factor 2 receptor